jgi:Flp pilus assembly protein TadG
MLNRNVRTVVGGFLRLQDGAAAVEFAIWLVVLIPLLVNGVDVALYVYDKTQVTSAAQAAVQAGYSKWDSCAPASSTSGCSGFSTAISNAISNSGRLGPKITTTTASGTEQYYCADTTTGTLIANGTSSSTCSSGATAGWYYPLKVTYNFTPTFRGVSIATVLNTTITQEAWIRLK